MDSVVLWVAVEVPCEEEKVAVGVDDGNAVEENFTREADALAVAVNAQPSARCEIFGAHG